MDPHHLPALRGISRSHHHPPPPEGGSEGDRAQPSGHWGMRPRVPHFAQFLELAFADRGIFVFI